MATQRQLNYLSATEADKKIKRWHWLFLLAGLGFLVWSLYESFALGKTNNGTYIGTIVCWGVLTGTMITNYRRNGRVWDNRAVGV